MGNAFPRNVNGFPCLDPNNPQLIGLNPIPMADNDPYRATYGYSVVGYNSIATNPTDVFTITGSATKTVRIRQIQISGFAASATSAPLNIIRRSTLNTGGTSTTPTAGQRDTADDPATATMRFYSVNPAALGTTSGTIDGGRLGLVAASGVSQIDRMNFQYGWLNEKAPVLRGATDSLCLNFGGQPWPSGGTLDIAIWWTEE